MRAYVVIIAVMCANWLGIEGGEDYEDTVVTICGVLKNLNDCSSYYGDGDSRAITRRACSNIYFPKEVLPGSTWHDPESCHSYRCDRATYTPTTIFEICDNWYDQSCQHQDQCRPTNWHL
ncbi:hypothetical protein Bbelb_083990 [Branchiostoma belcheri]|nr:hypothetical protein Bbelb_083990 [Branchiostoma belcheri]